MKLIETGEISEQEIHSLNLDYLICSSGFEARASFIARNLSINAKIKKVLCFNNYESEGHRRMNDEFYQAKKFEFIYEDGDQCRKIIELLNGIKENNAFKLSIGIDYSSMTRVWYSAIVSYFNTLQTNKNITIYFFYSFSKFSIPVNSSVRNTHIGPIRDFSTLSIPDKPTALIIGLGYEKERAFGLSEYFDAETYIFAADESKDQKYYEAVLHANNYLFEYAKPQNIFFYSLHHLSSTESLLYSVCKSLKSDFRLVLAPTGPKPFTLLCLLTAIRLKNIDVWRVSAGKYSKPTLKEPDGTWSCYKATFV